MVYIVMRHIDRGDWVNSVLEKVFSTSEAAEHYVVANKLEPNEFYQIIDAEVE